MVMLAGSVLLASFERQKPKILPCVGIFGLFVRLSVSHTIYCATRRGRGIPDRPASPPNFFVYVPEHTHKQLEVIHNQALASSIPSCYIMYMPNKSQNLRQKVVKITPQLQEMLDTFTEKWGFISESEVIRQAILFYYRKMEPEYLKPSFKQVEKKREQEERERVSAMTNEEYAENIMKARILRDKDGKKYAITLLLANKIKITPLEQIKIMDEQDPFYRTTHLQLLNEDVDFDFYLKNNEYKLNELGISI